MHEYFVGYRFKFELAQTKSSFGSIDDTPV